MFNLVLEIQAVCILVILNKIIFFYNSCTQYFNFISHILTLINYFLNIVNIKFVSKIII